MDARARALETVKPAGRTGVELGPLNRPLIRRSDGDVLYGDHLSTEALRHKYAGHGAVAGADPIVEVDLVLQDRTLAEALGTRGPVDYIVASHVAEHLADPIGWLNDCAAALREDGILFLVLPDKRFTFDGLRAPSTTGDLIGSHLAGARTASPAQVFEHCARAAEVNPGATWRGNREVPPRLPGLGLATGLAEARTVQDTGAYRDVHCSVFTPFSFAQVIGEVIALGLIPFALTDVVPTRFDDIEFFATLRNCGGVSPAERAAATPRLDPAAHHELPPAPILSRIARLRTALRILRTGHTRRMPAHHG
jgi:SAM-dependent methyltransferase